MNKVLAYKKMLLITALIFSLVTFFGCGNKSSVKYNTNDDMSSRSKPEAINNENDRNGYQERYQDYYQ